MPDVPPTTPASATAIACVGALLLRRSASMDTMAVIVRFRIYAGAAPMRLAAINAPSGTRMTYRCSRMPRMDNPNVRTPMMSSSSCCLVSPSRSDANMRSAPAMTSSSSSSKIPTPA